MAHKHKHKHGQPHPVLPGSPEEAYVMRMVAEWAERGDAEARLGHMIREGTEARANKTSRLFRPLVRLPDTGVLGVTWRTPYVIHGACSKR